MIFNLSTHLIVPNPQHSHNTNPIPNPTDMAIRSSYFSQHSMCATIRAVQSNSLTIRIVVQVVVKAVVRVLVEVIRVRVGLKGGLEGLELF